MDSWLLEEVDKVSSEPEQSDSEEVDNELESQLYSIIHHNNLNEPLPSDLAQHYSLQQSDDGDVTVSLKHSLEEPHDTTSTPADPEIIEVIDISDDDKNCDVIVVSESVKNERYSKKKLRYSDVNIDQLNESQNRANNLNHNTDRVATEESIDFTTIFSDVNALKELVVSQKYRQFSYINIPSTIDFSNWKSDSQASFIPVANKNDKLPKYKQEWIKALEVANPDVSQSLLARLVNIFLKLCTKRVKQLNSNGFSDLDNESSLSIKANNNLSKKAREGNLSLNSNNSNKPPHVLTFDKDLSLNINQPMIKKGKKTSKLKSKKGIIKSVSLNVSPFRPTSENSQSEGGEVISITGSQSSLFPSKWTKKMIDFYTNPCPKALDGKIEDIFRRFKKKSKPNEWKIDPRDASGVYHRPVTKQSRDRCINCKQRGHRAQNCQETKKFPVCFLCGGSFHNSFNCPKNVCLKCGVYTRNEECESCYYDTFQCHAGCEACGSATHRAPHCPDSWRRFHATTGEGEIRVPKEFEMNKRRFCCNCGNIGHFSHKCTAPLHTGQQIIPFVTNYSVEAQQAGETEIFLNHTFEEIFNSPETDEFLQDLSNSSNAKINLDQFKHGTLLKINGTFDQCKIVKSEIEDYVNTKKRKREEPTRKRKRRKLK